MLNVLIVEDDQTIADLLQEALEDDGFHVIGIAQTLDEAVLSAEQHLPDVAIVDIRLANGDLGTDLSARLHQPNNIRIMFSTGNSNDEKLMNSGGDAVMTKPYRLTDVGRSLEIIDQLARTGHTTLTFPRNFRLLRAAVLQPALAEAVS
jgi:DNA-binding response OmpR family regulator